MFGIINYIRILANKYISYKNYNIYDPDSYIIYIDDGYDADIDEGFNII